MSLRSENAGAGLASQFTATGFPARVLHADLPQREVARLEFLAVGAGAAEATEIFEAEAELPIQNEAAANATAISQEEIDALIDAAVSRVRSESREAWEKEVAVRVAAERSAVLKACERFSAERTRYFECVEAEVVKLTLAVAARILHRDARMDPLLLTAAARIALEKIADDSCVTLRVPSADAMAWREVFGEAVEKGVELIGDDGFEVGECVLETSVGKVDLGVSAQLAEIEEGFFDLLRQRPA